MATQAYYKPKLIDDYQIDEVSSSLNKAIRRNKEYEACFWCYVIHQSSYGAYLWRRLILICSEDIGNANQSIPILINSLASNWERLHKHNKEATLAKLALVFQAVQAMCQSPKTREIDNLRNLIAHRYQRFNERLTPPDYALDCHTGIGKTKYGKFGDYKDGREAERLENWYAEWCVVMPEAYKGKYLEELKQVEAEIIKVEKNKLLGEK